MTASRNGTARFLTVAFGSTPPLTTNGSGRIKNQITSDDSPNNTTANRKPPALESSPSDSATVPSPPIRLGASTAPNVAKKTTEPMSRLRVLSDARSAAAYRDMFDVPLPTPTMIIPSRNRGNRLAWMATTQVMAPSTATPSPSAIPGVRPRRCMNAASQPAAMADPSVLAPVDKPAQVSEPSMSLIASTATGNDADTAPLLNVELSRRTLNARLWAASVSTPSMVMASVSYPNGFFMRQGPVCQRRRGSRSGFH